MDEIMDPVILRDQEAARQYLLQGIWFQRAVHPSVNGFTRALEWSLIIADSGQPLPPTGFIADIGHAALGLDRENKARKESLTVPGFPPGLARIYEDHVLGKIYTDNHFERAGNALKQIEPEKPLGRTGLHRQADSRTWRDWRRGAFPRHHSRVAGSQRQ